MTRLWDLMARKLSGEATEKELEELKDLLRKDPALTYTAQMIEDLWNSKRTPDAEEATRAFERHLFRMIEKAQQGSRSQLAAPPSATLPASGSHPGDDLSWEPSYKRSQPFEALRRNLDILANYMKIAWRSLYRQLGFSNGPHPPPRRPLR
jgi:hypothetical protein